MTSGAIHRFRFGESECPGEFQATWFHVESGNCAGFVLLLTRILRHLTTIPRGLRLEALGCELASYPGWSEPGRANPNGVAAVLVQPRTQPRWG